MFSRLSLFGHVWCVEGVSNYTCLCAGCRQILGARFMSDISIVEEGFLIHVTTSQLVSSVQTIVYAVSRKDLHS